MVLELQRTDSVVAFVVVQRAVETAVGRYDVVVVLMDAVAAYRMANQLRWHCVARMANLLEELLVAYSASADENVADVASVAELQNTGKGPAGSAGEHFGLD